MLIRDSERASILKDVANKHRLLCDWLCCWGHNAILQGILVHNTARVWYHTSGMCCLSDLNSNILFRSDTIYVYVSGVACRSDLVQLMYILYD